MGNNFYIFGAGFTKAVFADAPLNAQLLGGLLDADPSSPLKALSKKYGTKDIELLLTRLDIEIQQGQYNLEVRNSINREIAVYFQQFRFAPDILSNVTWLEEFARNVFGQDDVILNLNYETFLEGLLDYFEVWSPNHGYGGIGNVLVGEENVNHKNIQVLKIHGSEHFTLQNYFDKPESVALSYEFNQYVFPRSGAHSFLGPRSIPRASTGRDNAKAYIIAPSFVKIPTVEIAYLMIDAIKAIEKARKVIIAGCGLRPEDSFLWLLLTHFLRQPGWRQRKIVIISPDACALGSRIKRYWGVNVGGSIMEISAKLEDAVKILVAVATTEHL